MNFRFAVEILGAILAGALIPFQTAYNTQLARALQSPLISALAVFVAGLVAMLVIVAAARAAGIIPAWPSAAQAASAPVVSWAAGGVLGALYIVLLIVLAPRLGAGAVVALVMVGQIVFSGLIDHFGLLGFEERPLNAMRRSGMALLAGGAALVRLY